MKRRSFLKTSVAATGLAGLSSAGITASAADTSPAPRDYYELRVYRLKAGSDHHLLDDYLEKALIPALNRIDISPVGVFTEMDKDVTSIYTLIPYPSIESFSSAWARVNADADYQKAGADYLQAPKSDPRFERIDSWLLLAFAGMPKLQLPALSQEKKPRIFEMRTYDSHSEAKALKKVEMFNSGEIDAMKEVGLGPVFYGQALIGRDLPHLTYMLSAEDRAAHQKHFGAFGAHPTWKRLNGDPQYADTVSKTTMRFLVPAAYSQI